MLKDITDKLPEYDEFLTRQEAKEYTKVAPLQGLRATIPSMGAERKHRDR